MPLIDTLTLKTDLLDGGMPEPQAAAIVKALVHADTEHLATKADLDVLRADVNAKIDALRAEMNTKIEMLRAEVSAKIEALRTEVNAKIDALQADVNMKNEALRGDFKALNGKLNLLLAFNTPLVIAVLALLWRLFYAGQGPGG